MTHQFAVTAVHFQVAHVSECMHYALNQSRLLRSFSVLAACVVPSNKPSLAWNRGVKHIIMRNTYIYAPAKCLQP